MRRGHSTSKALQRARPSNGYQTLSTHPSSPSPPITPSSSPTVPNQRTISQHALLSPLPVSVPPYFSLASARAHGHMTFRMLYLSTGREAQERVNAYTLPTYQPRGCARVVDRPRPGRMRDVRLPTGSCFGQRGVNENMQSNTQGRWRRPYDPAVLP